MGPKYTGSSQSLKRGGWLEIRIEIHPLGQEAVSAFLFDLGCEGIVMEAPEGKGLKAYLRADRDFSDTAERVSEFLNGLKGFFPHLPTPSFSLKRVANEDWNAEWRKFFAPAQVTPSLLVCPAWETPSFSEKRYVILMDPGPAFGTGNHPTTRMCLRAMERVHKPKGWTMMDVGTGSGILAIYGALLGARRVVGIDIDPEALRWARHNVSINRLSGEIELSDVPVERWNESFRIVTANLTFGEIQRLMPDFFRVVSPGGFLILSGFLKEQTEPVKEAMEGQGFKSDQVFREEEWACVTAKRSSWTSTQSRGTG